MSKRTEGKKLMPRLRFPEFRDAGPWEVKRLGEVAKLITERAGENDYLLLSITAGVGLIPQSEKFGREIAGKQKRNYYVIRRYDFAYNKSATKEYPQGYIALYEGDEPAAVPNSIFVCFRPVLHSASPNYMSYLFEANFHGRYLEKVITIGARAHGSLNIDNNDVLAIPLPMPTLEEQQKIADCFSSLDEVIELQAKKLEALKAYKKGLMQQLFPREGEATPRLRFPEFRDAGPWEVKRLGDIAESLTSLSGKTSKDFGRGNALYVPYINVYENTFVDPDRLERVDIGLDEKQNAVRPGDILFTVSSETPDEAGMSSVVLDDISSCYVNSFCTIYRPIQSVQIDYVFVGYYLRSPIVRKHFLKTAQGAIRFNLNRKAFDRTPILLPSPREQQKIADCLSSLDEVIELQAKKLEALKAHKKGLMQRLFPQEEV